MYSQFTDVANFLLSAVLHTHTKNLKQQNKSTSEYTHLCLQTEYLKTNQRTVGTSNSWRGKKSFTWMAFDKNPEIKTKPAQNQYLQF